MSADLRLGVDTGGTFTDLVLYDPQGPRFDTYKLLSTPKDPSTAVLRGLQVLLSRHFDSSEKLPILLQCFEASEQNCRIIHGSTVATNAWLEGKGARTAFITTKGFEDTFLIARQNRPSLYELEPQRPKAPIDRCLCFGVDERTLYDGSILKALKDQAIARLELELQGRDIESIAVSFLHSYANPTHEKQVGKFLRKTFPSLHITLSHELLPEFREYERASTCLVNAVVAPPMQRYLKKLTNTLGGERLRIMASSGGTLPVEVIEAMPVQTILSGPAGGGVGAIASAKLDGIDRIITFDMGGTSTDVALFESDLRLSTEADIGLVPLRIPVMDIHTVGAGGGSIAWLDQGGALRVGPHSAGADPGPACYGRQSEESIATVTDAHVCLGHLPKGMTLGEGIILDHKASEAALAGLGKRLGKSVEETALGILRVVEASMTRAIYRISLLRGHDPREFVLLPFGGAGALHACRLAEGIGIQKVFIPCFPGLLSAMGMIFAKSRYTFSQSIMQRFSITDAGSYPEIKTDPVLQNAYNSLLHRVKAAVNAEASDLSDWTWVVYLALRYQGQSYELEVTWDHSDPVTAFIQKHLSHYGYDAPGREIEVVQIRIRADRDHSEFCLPKKVQTQGNRQSPKKYETHEKKGTWREVERSSLEAGEQLSGPLIVREFSATTLVPDGWELSVLTSGALVLSRGDSDVI